MNQQVKDLTLVRLSHVVEDNAFPALTDEVVKMRLRAVEKEAEKKDYLTLSLTGPAFPDSEKVAERSFEDTLRSWLPRLNLAGMPIGCESRVRGILELGTAYGHAGPDYCVMIAAVVTQSATKPELVDVKFYDALWAGY